MREAALWLALWIGLALVFDAVLYFWQGPVPAMEFFTGYLLEKALTVDNLFVFVVIFTVFGVSALYQHPVLFWGVLGALVMRAVFVALGGGASATSFRLLRVRGVLGVHGRWKLPLREGRSTRRRTGYLVFRRVLPVTETGGGHASSCAEGGRWSTPLLLVLLVVEGTDVVFAVDSIPAVFAVTPDPFLVYTSNVFAILGLRASTSCCRADGKVPLSEAGAVAHPGLCGHQDADRRLLQDPHHALAGRHRRHIDRFRCGFADTTAPVGRCGEPRA